jgi:zinc protease
MKRLIVLLLVAVSWSGIMSKDAPKVFPYSYSVETLENGLKVIIIPMDSPGLAAYYSVVRTGSRDEWEQGKSGFAHFFEHMMFRGTEKYPGPVYDSIITSLGADANAYTSNDLTVYHLNFASEDLPKVIEMESDRFQFLKYSESQFQTESGAVYGEYRKGRTSPWSVLEEEMCNMAFDKHTYKHTTIGFEKDIKNMPHMYDYSLSFFKRYYRPENVVIAIVGDVDKEKTMALIKKYYSGWKPGYVSPQITPEPPQTAERAAEITYEGKTLPILAIAFKGDAFDANNKNVLSVEMLGDLAFGETSDIYKKLVLNEQKVQFIQADFSYSRDPGLLYIYTMVKDENDIDSVKAEILKTLEKFKKEPVDAKKLENLKKRNKYGFLMGLDNPDNVSAYLPRFITLTGGIDVIDQIYANYDTIHSSDLQKAANYYFTPEKRNVIVLKGSVK